MKVYEFKQIYWSKNDVPHVMTSLYFPEKGILEKIPLKLIPEFDNHPMTIEAYNSILLNEKSKDKNAEAYAKNRELEYVRTLDLESRLVNRIIKSGKNLKQAQESYEGLTRGFVDKLKLEEE